MKRPTQIIKKYTNISLVLRIFIGLVIGALLGLIFPSWTGIGILGQMFVSALKGIAPVLVAVLVTSSIAKASKGHGHRFVALISVYMLSTFIAAICAVVGSFIFPVTLRLGEVPELEGAAGSLSEVFTNLLTGMLTNPIMAIANANYIAILFWSIIIGIALKKLANKSTIAVVHDFATVISKVVKWIIEFAPFGILGLVFTAVSENGFEVFTSYGHLLLLLVGCMLVNTLVFNPLISFVMLRKNPYPLLFTCLKESGLNAFFTRSSAANIPINMALCKKLNLDEDFYSVSIPLGATINMDGAAVTITVFALAVAHTMGWRSVLLRRSFWVSSPPLAPAAPRAWQVAHCCSFPWPARSSASAMIWPCKLSPSVSSSVWCKIRSRPPSTAVAMCSSQLLQNITIGRKDKTKDKNGNRKNLTPALARR